METQLLAAVAREYSALPASRLSWPDPHPGRQPAASEEYSRVTNPARYQVVGARATAWERALVGLGLASAESSVVPTGWFVPRGARASLIVPKTAGALPLVVVRGDFAKTPDTAITTGIAAADPIYLAITPDCGCDACDYGSADLLEAIDAHYLTVVAGGFVYASGPDWTAHTNYNGWQSNGRAPGDLERMFADARAGRSVRVPIVTGAAWWAFPATTRKRRS